jgi:hypothetical protein
VYQTVMAFLKEKYGLWGKKARVIFPESLL